MVYSYQFSKMHVPLPESTLNNFYLLTGILRLIQKNVVLVFFTQNFTLIFILHSFLNIILKVFHFPSYNAYMNSPGREICLIHKENITPILLFQDFGIIKSQEKRFLSDHFNAVIVAN